MISFKTNGAKECTDVICRVTFGTTLPSDRSVFHFKWQTSDPHFAYLLAKHFQDELEKAIKEAHRRAYEIGYKDGKGKQKKRTDFSSRLDSNMPAW